MIYSLKEYQRGAVDELKGLFELYFRSSTRKEIVFKSPTGSGKTFMASSLMEELASENSDINFCIMWACPGKGELHKQSFDNVKKYLGGNPVCSLLEEDFFGSRKYIKNHEIVFINWEKLIQKDKETGKWANNLMKDQEGQNFIDVIDQTRRNGTKVILIIDESHIGKSAKARIQEFINTIICPNIVLEMSATPLNEHIDVVIEPQKVIDEGMIKEDVIVNEGISKEDRSMEDTDSELLVLEKGHLKREELKKKYESIGSLVNPLVLIQIPNVDEGEAKKLVIKDFLREKGITEDNGKLKFWCDDKGYFDKKKIKNLDDETEYLVFKTAVATGWDCPRAQILIKFREGKSETFEIQTIGRILRTAEAKSYNNNLLDNAYIFTNIKEFETKPESYNPNKVKTEFSYFAKPYNRLMVWEQTQLRSFYRSRQGDYNSADSNYSAYFFKSFMKFFGLTDEDKLFSVESNIEKFKLKGFDLTIDTKDTLIEETTIDVADIEKEQSVSGEQASVKMAENDVQAQYYALIKENLNGLAYVRSKSPINSAIMDAFMTFYNVFPRSERVSLIQRIVVNNKTIFAEILDESTREFREMLQQNAGKKGEHYDFKIEDKRAYSTETHVTIRATKSLYQPLFVLKGQNGHINYLEKDFLNYLDEQENVRWYWENGFELMRINFGISYNNGMNTFQPDFIVKFADGTVGIFDTKAIDQRIEDTKVKQEALFNYLHNINLNRGYAPKVIGGIVIKTGSQFFLFEGKDYHAYTESTQGWRNFNELIGEIDDEINVIKYLKDKEN